MSSCSESDHEEEVCCISDGSSQQEDPTITSRKTLFKGKSKGEGKSSAKAAIKENNISTLSRR